MMKTGPQWPANVVEGPGICLERTAAPRPLKSTTNLGGTKPAALPCSYRLEITYYGGEALYPALAHSGESQRQVCCFDSQLGLFRNGYVPVTCCTGLRNTSCKQSSGVMAAE